MAFGDELSRKPVQSIHVAYSSSLTVSRQRTIGCGAREPPPVERVGGVPPLEPIMINLKVLSTAAALALVLPIVLPSASFAQAVNGHGQRGGGGGARQGGGGMHHGGGGGPHFSGGGGGGYHGGGGYYRGGGGGAFIPGLAAGAIIGGAIAATGGGYGPGYAPGPGYYDEGYDDGAVAVAPAPGGDDAVAYCMQTYRSYDPRSGTYMGNDGYRHPCP
jgi:hypothetical protein